jgi:hypothetical protein
LVGFVGATGLAVSPMKDQVFVEGPGLVVRRRMRRASAFSLTWREILSAERHPRGKEFIFQVRTRELPLTVRIKSSDIRAFERRFRDAGVNRGSARMPVSMSHRSRHGERASGPDMSANQESPSTPPGSSVEIVNAAK